MLQEKNMSHNGDRLLGYQGVLRFLLISDSLAVFIIRADVYLIYIVIVKRNLFTSTEINAGFTSTICPNGGHVV